LNYALIIPAADVQARFDDLTYPFLETILSNHEQSQNLATLRDTLLPRLISGQLRLPEAQGIVESV
jgi:type I restriction enzyme S subunit